MIFRVRRFAGWPALLGSSVLTACSSTPPQSPDAYVDATIQTAADRPGECNLGTQQTMLAVGTATADKPTAVTDGNQQNGQATVHVSCTVTASGSGFDIQLQATQDGTNGGTLIITSPQGKGAVTDQGAQNVTGVWESQLNGTDRENDCTISYTYGGGAVPVSPPIAAGRIWGHLSCPHATIDGQTTTGPDGGAVNITCDNEADFMFENCSQ